MFTLYPYLFIIIIIVVLYYLYTLYKNKDNFSQSNIKPDIIGSIKIYSGKYNLPNGYSICDGSRCDKEKYKLLYNIIGNKYGPADINLPYFNLPNLSNRFILGTADKNLGSNGGSWAIDHLTVDNLPTHEHEMFKQRDKSDKVIYDLAGSLEKKFDLNNPDRTKILFSHVYHESISEDKSILGWMEGRLGRDNDKGRSYSFLIGGELPNYGKTSEYGINFSNYNPNFTKMSVINPYFSLYYIIYTGVLL
jgi:microcystin-dependent protein